MAVKVHLCCGDVYLTGYQNVDACGDLVHIIPDNCNETTFNNYYKRSLYSFHRPIVDRFLILPDEWVYEGNSVQEFLMICAIEHMIPYNAKLLVERVYDSLSINGMFRFDFPDLLKTIDLYKNKDTEHMMRLIYGSGKNEWGFHRWGYTKESIKQLLSTRTWKSITFGEIVPHEYPIIGVTAIK